MNLTGQTYSATSSDTNTGYSSTSVFLNADGTITNDAKTNTLNWSSGATSGTYEAYFAVSTSSLSYGTFTNEMSSSSYTTIPSGGKLTLTVYASNSTTTTRSDTVSGTLYIREKANTSNSTSLTVTLKAMAAQNYL